MSRKIHYICSYVDERTRDRFMHWPSSLPKIGYMVHVLTSISPDVTIVSHCLYQPGAERVEDYSLPNGVKCKYIMRPGQKLLKGKMLYLSMCERILNYIFRHVKDNDIVIVYHSLLFRYILPICRRIKKFRLIYEVNELFYPLYGQRFRQSEMKELADADGYVLITELLSDKINIRHLPEVINHSSYLPMSLKKNDIGLDKNKIHVVYAGAIETVRHAAFYAVETAKYLPDNYQVHILGFGKQDDLEKLKMAIADINADTEERVIYHGTMYGSEYDQFLINCEVGLNCHTYAEEQKESADVSFPSKVLIYLQHNLRVVSFPLKCLEMSQISDCITFSSKTTAESLANAIIEASSLPQIDGRVILSELDSKFTQKLKAMIDSI